MFTAADVVFWGPEEALHEFKQRLPLGWTLTLRVESRCAVAELQDEQGVQVWASSHPDPKLLYLEGLGWLMTRDHKPRHPVWRPRDRDVALRVPNPASSFSVPPDLDPDEIAAVYRNRR